MIGLEVRNKEEKNLFIDYPDVLNIEDIQKALGIGRDLAYRLIRSGKIKYKKIGREYKVPKPYLIDFILSDHE